MSKGASFIKLAVRQTLLAEFRDHFFNLNCIEFCDRYGELIITTSGQEYAVDGKDQIKLLKAIGVIEEDS